MRDMPVILVTDSKSMFDFLHKRRSTPAEKHLRLDLEMIRDEMDESGLRVMWVRSEQQLADALTKGRPGCHDVFAGRAKLWQVQLDG